MNGEQLALLIGVLSPLVGVPLIVISLYLRAIREHQTTTMAEMTHRIETMECSMRDLLKSKADFEREYTTKEEWVRESMLARQRLERLTEMITRIETELENGQLLAAELSRATTAMIEIVKQLSGQQGDNDVGTVDYRG
ncbi:MAG: hypothetical protein JSV03_03755 [Planctomycetota bacterium]|nr:MAG: hypothetical protein JSV03_03755 [Planctomycetota bacterium]